MKILIQYETKDSYSTEAQGQVLKRAHKAFICLIFYAFHLIFKRLLKLNAYLMQSQ